MDTLHCNNHHKTGIRETSTSHICILSSTHVFVQEHFANEEIFINQSDHRDAHFFPAQLNGLCKFLKISIVLMLELQKKKVSHALHVMRKSQRN